MAGIKSIEKLRKFAENAVYKDNYIAGSTFDLNRIADEIEAEIAERYMELPVDADGEVIRLGDEMDCGEVIGIGEYIAFFGEGIEWQHYSVQAIHHIKPRTIEDVLQDLCIEADERYGEDCRAELIVKAADEIRGLL